jgi:hypothetical protein
MGDQLAGLGPLGATGARCRRAFMLAILDNLMRLHI